MWIPFVETKFMYSMVIAGSRFLGASFASPSFNHDPLPSMPRCGGVARIVREWKGAPCDNSFMQKHRNRQKLFDVIEWGVENHP